MNSNDALPFLKWAGGKRQLLNQFEELYPQKLKDGNIATYIEPFVGGGAVFFDLQKKYKFQKVLLNDINEDLILAYKVIQSNCSELLISLKRLEERFINLQSIELQSIMFYEIRNIFNKEKKSMDYSILDSAWISHASNLIFLNKTCFNGLYRLNKSGDFNVPFGKYKNPNIINEPVIRAVSHYLNTNNIEIFNKDYLEILANTKKNSFVYLDPPYHPISESSNFTGYIKGGFSMEDQIRLREACDLLNSKGIKFLLSNSASDFILEQYKNYDIHIVKARRAINSIAIKRGDVEEVLIRNYE